MILVMKSECTYASNSTSVKYSSNQLIMRCDIAFKILLAVSAKFHNIEVSQCRNLHG